MEPQPPPPFAVPPPADRLYSPGDVALATFLGAPAAGGVVLALNYRKWGQKPLAAATVAVGVVVTAILGWLAWIVPSYIPSVVFLAPQVIGGYLVAKWLQGRKAGSISPEPPPHGPGVVRTGSTSATARRSTTRRGRHAMMRDASVTP